MTKSAKSNPKKAMTCYRVEFADGGWQEITASSEQQAQEQAVSERRGRRRQESGDEFMVVKCEIAPPGPACRWDNIRHTYTSKLRLMPLDIVQCDHHGCEKTVCYLAEFFIDDFSGGLIPNTIYLCEEHAPEFAHEQGLEFSSTKLCTLERGNPPPPAPENEA